MLHHSNGDQDKAPLAVEAKELRNRAAEISELY